MNKTKIVSILTPFLLGSGMPIEAGWAPQAWMECRQSEGRCILTIDLPYSQDLATDPYAPPADLIAHDTLSDGHLTCSDPDAPPLQIQYYQWEGTGWGPSLDGGDLIGCISERTFTPRVLWRVSGQNWEPLTEFVEVTE